ncbi:hypothetical protein TNIN_280741 [Trichonephila inaurata madagascariensis]|uniref:Uncharacterized protein n=1 Tax=Trichonephila inaurata madagascariensis TaxID=2747483 RepID=A0A8X6Y687_9ARAC|nr:hypothetical protein TNIN_280741 [Trichonephila inaurata madagascariensis]
MFNLILYGNRLDKNSNELNDFWKRGCLRTEGHPIPIRQNLFTRILGYLHVLIQTVYIGLRNLLHCCECSEQLSEPHSKPEGTLPRSVNEPYDFGSKYSAELNTRLNSTEIPRTEQRLSKIQSSPINIPYKHRPYIFVPPRPVPTFSLDPTKLNPNGLLLNKKRMAVVGKCSSVDESPDKTKNPLEKKSTKEIEEIFIMSPLL